MIESITEQICKNAQNADFADKKVAEVGKEIVEGDRGMKELVAAMNEINQATAEISKVIKVIDDIAFQTNILALNASVEAAHGSRRQGVCCGCKRSQKSRGKERRSGQEHHNADRKLCAGC